MKAGGFLGLLTLVVVGVILADVLLHPEGVNAAGGQANTFAKSSYNALLGKTS